MIAQVDDKKKKKDLDEGPFSALFDYSNEEKRIQEERERQHQAEEKIMRTNAIGDAFRLLIEGVGGKKGATINPHQVNPAILSAAERHRQADTEYKQKLSQLRLQDLDTKIHDLQYQHGLEAESRQAEREDKRADRKYDWEEDMFDKQANLKKELVELEAGIGDEKMKKQADLQTKKQKEIDTHRTNENIREAIATGKYDRTGQDPVIPDMKITDRNYSGETVEVDSDLASAMLSELSKNLTSLDPNDMSVLRSLLVEGTKNRGQSVQVLLNKYWDRVRHLHPGLQVMEQAEVPLTPEQEKAQSLLAVKIRNVLGNTSYKENKKKRLIRKALQEYNPDITDEYADEMASYYLQQSGN